MHILIVEDKEPLAEMLKRALIERNDSAVLAFNGLDGLSEATQSAFDGIVMDLMLPGLAGSEVVRRLRASGDRTPILILTARDTVGDLVRLLDLGANYYLTKPFAVAEFMARLWAVVRRGPVERGVQLEVADLTLDQSTGEVMRSGQRIALTRTEHQLLEVLMRRTSQVVTRNAIIERVWGESAEIEANTLEVFIKNLRAKVDQNREVKLIHTVRGIGYRLQAGER